MKYVIAVFSSRSETLSFANYLKKFGYPNAIVSTPKVASRSCGISVKFRYEDFENVKKMVSSLRFSTFMGFYM